MKNERRNGKRTACNVLRRFERPAVCNSAHLPFSSQHTLIITHCVQHGEMNGLGENDPLHREGLLIHENCMGA